MRNAFAPALLLTACVAACGPGASTDDAGGADARNPIDAGARDARGDAPVDAYRYDAGPQPACTVAAFARRVADRPGGDLVQPPQYLAEVDNGYLLGAHRVDSSADAGAPSRDTLDLIPVAGDGTPRGPAVTLRDALATGEVLSAPVIVPAGGGALVLFTAGNGLALSDPTSRVQLYAAAVGALGAGGAPAALRDRYVAPLGAPLASGRALGVAVHVEPPTDSGIVVAAPEALYLDARGGELRPQDQDLAPLIPFDAAGFSLGTTDAGGAVYGYVTESQLGFVPFLPDGTTEPHGSHVVRGSSPVPSSPPPSFAGAGDAVVGAWAQTAAGGVTEVHAVVAGTLGDFRVERVLEQFTGEGMSVATAVPTWGGVAVLWRRGVDANARVRVAVLAPDGRVVLPAQDLVAAPGLEGPITARATGREVAFAAQQGLGPDWGYLLGRACIPAP